MKLVPIISRFGILLLAVLICYSGCIPRTIKRYKKPAPVEIKINWLEHTLSDGQLNMSIGGGPMTSRSNKAIDGSQVSFISGTIDGMQAKGFVLSKERSPDQPVFRVLGAISERDGQPVALLEGRSSVKWRLVVEGTNSIRIHNASGKAMDSPATFTPGSFTIKATERKGEEK